MAKPLGRPTIFNPKIEEEICSTVSVSTKMLEELCDEYPHWPCANAIYERRIRDKNFGEMYVRAKQSQIEPLVSNMLKLARDGSHDWIFDDENKMVPNTPHLTRLRIEIDTTKWLAGKLCPRLYGEKKEADVGDKSKSLLQDLIDKL